MSPADWRRRCGGGGSTGRFATGRWRSWRLAILVDPDTDFHAWTIGVSVADRFRLTMYDSVYLELALRRRRRLATLDPKLRAAASILGVQVLGLDAVT